ncbi:MAG: PHP domain-containing protein, partial [Oscillospiraceae bacterium]
MKIIADTHTHTLASTHAYSTILENAKFAKETGMVYLAMTDHAPSLTDAPHLWHFHNLRVLPEEIYGVKILKGCEVNILNKNGDLDMDFSDEHCDLLNWIVTSFHSPTCEPMSVQDTTNAYLNIAKNPRVDVIGHSGTASYEYDYETAIKAFRDNNKLVEINEASFNIRQE